MKSYISIPGKIVRDVPVHLFDKLDGSNIRTEWTRKGGFAKFGTRRQLIHTGTEGSPDSTFGRSVDLFREKYEDDLIRIFREQRYQKATVFLEFWGPKSFAGNHFDDDTQTVTLFDVAPHKMGILEPTDFLKLFGDLDIVKYFGCHKVGKEMEETIRSSQLEGVTFEGVVGKGKPKGKMKMPLMFKVKTRAWINKLKMHCGPDQKLFSSLL